MMYVEQPCKNIPSRFNVQEIEEEAKLAFSYQGVEEVNAESLRRIEVMEELVQLYIGIVGRKELGAVFLEDIRFATSDGQYVAFGNVPTAITEEPVLVQM
jgi:hypothetical protein